MSEAFTADAQPALFKNQHDGEIKQFFINPDELNVAMKNKFKQLDILGMPNVPLVHERTENMGIKFSLYLHAFHIQHEGRVSRQRARQEVKDFRAFLSSLILPLEKQQKGWVGGDGPPTVWFSWPNVISMPGKIGAINWKLKQFEISGHSVFEVAQVDFLANWPQAIWSEEIRLTGWELG